MGIFRFLDVFKLFSRYFRSMGKVYWWDKTCCVIALKLVRIKRL